MANFNATASVSVLLFTAFAPLYPQTFGVAILYSYGGSVGNYQYLLQAGSRS